MITAFLRSPRVVVLQEDSLNLQETEASVQFEVDLDELRNLLEAGLEEIPQEQRDTVS